MNKIKVGDYIRTYDGYIGKLVKIIPNVLNNLKIDVKREIKHCDNSIDNYIYTRKGFIVKHSEYIKDLIKIGDYVDGHRVIEVSGDTSLTKEVYCEDEPDFGLWETDIGSIVTKEQFERMEYKV